MKLVRIISIIGLFALLLSSCAPRTPYMKKTEAFLSPDTEKVLVRFISPKAFGYLFDSEKFIGYMVPKTQFDYLTEPGKHLFIVSMENKAFLEAELEGGKTYYILLRSYMGVWTARTAFIAVSRGSEYWDKVNEYEAKFMKIEQDSDAIEKWESVNQHKAKAVVEQYEPVWKDKYAWEQLRPEDGR